MNPIIRTALTFLSGVVLGFTIVDMTYDAKVRRMNERLDYYRRYQKL